MSLESRYKAAAHAMQSGVAAEMEIGSQDTDPKHLRVGVNSALVNDAALTRLLIKKGIISEAEYLVELTEEMEREVRRYEARLSAHFGGEIRLK